MTRKKDDNRPLWQFPWAYRESFIFVFGLTLTGYLLQFVLGNIRALSFPGNLVVLIACILAICLLHFSKRESSIVVWFRSVPLSVATISMLFFQGVIMGIVPQNTSAHTNPHDIFGLTDVMSSWPFILTILALLFNLGFVILHKCIPLKRKNISFLINHLGLWITLAAGTLGAGDLQRYEMFLEEGETIWMASNGAEDKEMSFAIQLNDFEMEEYAPKLTIVNTHTNEALTKGKNALRQIAEGDEFSIAGYEVKIQKYYPEARNISDRYEPVNDFGAAPAALVYCSTPENTDTTAWLSCGSFASFPALLRFNDSTALVMMMPEPQSFRSHVLIYTPDKKAKEAVIEVNKPVSVDGWKIYQLSYNEEMGKYSTTSTVEVIKDPWLPVVYCGIFMLILGAVLLIFRGAGKQASKIEYSKTDCTKTD